MLLKTLIIKFSSFASSLVIFIKVFSEPAMMEEFMYEESKEIVFSIK